MYVYNNNFMYRLNRNNKILNSKIMYGINRKIEKFVSISDRNFFH